MKYIWLLILIITTSPNSEAQDDVTQSFRMAIDSIYEANKEAIGIMAHIEAPDIGLSWSGAAGYSDIKSKEALQPNQPILIASSIKTYVAATILRLVEEGRLTLEDSIDDLVKDATRNLLTNDGYDLTAIQVKHLMSHTSGIWNYANQAYLDHKRLHPKYRWSRDEQIQLTVGQGDPVGQPEEHFHYSDANYLLLTEIIEGLTNLPFYEAMRSLLRYEAIGLDDTWFPTLEDKPAGTAQQAHQYWSSYDWDSYELDISWDLYGGGGIAATTEDMASFIQHFFNGDIVEDDTVRNQIFTEVTTRDTVLYPYYLGLSQDSYHGMVAYGHGGFWSTVMMYFPSLNASISVCILDRDYRTLRGAVLETISKILLKEADADKE